MCLPRGHSRDGAAAVPAERSRRLGVRPRRVNARFSSRFLVTTLLIAIGGCAGSVPTSSDPAGPANTGQPADPPVAATLPASLAFTLEIDAAAEEEVTFEAGGTVSTTAADGSTFELIVPPMAVATAVEIRMTPLSSVTGVTAEEAIVHAVQLAPEGRVFFEPARLTITPATPIAVADQLMFEAAGDGTDPHPALIDPRSESIVVLLDHFSVAGVASVTPNQRAAFLRKSAENATTRLQREAQSIIQEERVRQLLSGEEDLEGRADRVEADLDEYDREVVDKLRQAAMLSCKGLETYVTTLIGAERQRQLLLFGDEEAMMARIFEAVSAMTARYQACEKEAIDKCKAAKDPAILIEFWLTMGKEFGLAVGDPAALKAKADQLCVPGFVIEFSGSGFPLRTPNFGTDQVLDVVGRAEGCPGENGAWLFGGEITYVHRSELVNEFEATRDLIDTIGSQTPERFSLDIGLTVPGNTLTFTDALGQPTGTLSYVNVFGDAVGPFQLELVRTDLACSEQAP